MQAKVGVGFLEKSDIRDIRHTFDIDFFMNKLI